MTSIKIPCPHCADGFTTSGDRHARTKQDVCPNCEGTAIAPARTGETPATSFTPSLTNPNPKRERVAGPREEFIQRRDIALTAADDFTRAGQTEAAMYSQGVAWAFDRAISYVSPVSSSPGDPVRAALEKARPLVADRVAAQSGRIGDREYASILAEVDAALSVSTPTGEGEADLIRQAFLNGTEFVEDLAHPQQGGERYGALSDIAAERRRQVEAEGWTPEHDAEHSRGEMATAAACYAYVSPLSEHARRRIANEGAPYRWPWDASWWKPTDARRDLVKAGALIVAEIERLDRATAPASASKRSGEEA